MLSSSKSKGELEYTKSLLLEQFVYIIASAGVGGTNGSGSGGIGVEAGPPLIKLFRDDIKPVVDVSQYISNLLSFGLTSTAANILLELVSSGCIPIDFLSARPKAIITGLLEADQTPLDLG